MRMIVLFGPPAVGKMTVGKALSARTGMPLLYNHMTIDAVLPLFPFGSLPFRKLVRLFRAQLIEAVAESDHPGLILTYVWSLGLPEDKEGLDHMTRAFRERGADVRYVELAATLPERLRRNRLPDRLEAKPTKRDTERSEGQLLRDEGVHQMNTGDEPFCYADHHLKIETTDLTADDVAERIVAWLGD